ncbi:hypothetical protein STEG23_035565 [Scotinomys teguina]
MESVNEKLCFSVAIVSQQRQQPGSEKAKDVEPEHGENLTWDQLNDYAKSYNAFATPLSSVLDASESMYQQTFTVVWLKILCHLSGGERHRSTLNFLRKSTLPKMGTSSSEKSIKHYLSQGVKVNITN